MALRGWIRDFQARWQNQSAERSNLLRQIGRRTHPLRYFPKMECLRHFGFAIAPGSRDPPHFSHGEDFYRTRWLLFRQDCLTKLTSRAIRLTLMTGPQLSVAF